MSAPATSKKKKKRTEKNMLVESCLKKQGAVRNFSEEN